jgi:hypothetical protein
VKQGFADEKGNLVTSDVCGVRASQGASCDVAPFKEKCFSQCARYIAHQNGGERHILIPKSELEYLPELGGLSNFSEMDLM